MRKSSEVMAQMYNKENQVIKNTKRKKSSEVLNELGIDFNSIKQEKDTSGLFQKSNGNFIQTVGATAGDLVTDIGEGFLSAVEGIADWGQYRTADVLNLVGAKKAASAVKENADFNSTGAIFGKNENPEDNFKKGWTKKLEENSVLGDTFDTINQGIGQVGAMAGTAALTGGSTLATALSSYTSAYGNARSEAYKNGADDNTAKKTAMISGFSEAIAEQFFNGIPGMKTEGWADKFTGKLAGGLEKVFGTKIGKTFLKVTDALGEGAEEMISNALQATGNDIVHFFDKNYNYGMENQSGNVFNDFVNAFTSEDSIKSFFSAAMTSALIGGGNTFLNQTQKNIILKEYAKDNDISLKEAKAQLNSTVNAETKAQSNNLSFNDRMELQGNIEKQELNNMKRNVFVEQGQKDQVFQYKETDNEQVNNMLKSLSEKGNNTVENHETAQIAEKLIRDFGFDVEFTNNRELRESGRAENADGYKEGNKLVLNLDSKELSSYIMGHETTHFLENQGELYDAVRNAVFELAKTRGVLDKHLSSIKKTYAKYIDENISDRENELGRTLTTEEKQEIEDKIIKSELTANYVGSFFTDEDFFRTLGKNNPSKLQQFAEFLKELYYKVTGNQEKSQILKAQQSIRKVYAEYTNGGQINLSNSIDSIKRNKAISEQKQLESINIPTIQENSLQQAETKPNNENLPTIENAEQKLEKVEKKIVEVEKKLDKIEQREENLPTKIKIDNAEGIKKIKSKYDSAKKITGNKKTIVLANGEKLSGTYKLLEAGNVSASHNVETFEKTEGFPVTENGTTVNDRDYQNDKTAQKLVIQKAGNYDGRAFADNGVIVTKDGIVISGNDRTMSGNLAAKNNTDSKYIEYLKDNAQQFGFTEEQIESMNHPRVVLEINENVDYDTKTFAKFNKDSKKSKSISEKAKEIGKTIDEDTINDISNVIDNFDSIDDLYNSEKATKELLNILQNKGIIDSNEVSEIYNGSKFTGSGKDLIESVVLGSVISEENAKYFSNNNDLKFKIMKVAPSIIQNKTLNNYSINDVINNAIEVYKKASTSGKTIDEFTKQYNIFGDNEVDLVTKKVAQLLETKGYKSLNNFLEQYNEMAKSPAFGQYDLFNNGIETKDDILKKALRIDSNTPIQYLLIGSKGAKNLRDNENRKYRNLYNLKDSARIIFDETKGNLESKNTKTRELTGWFKTKYGDWATLISDSNSKLLKKLEPNKTYKLGEILKHDLLYEAYPELKKIKIRTIDMNQTGAYRTIKFLPANTIFNDIVLKNSDLKRKNFKKTLLHEINHYIQQKEKYNPNSRGSNSSNKEGYHNNLGELISNETKINADLTQEELDDIILPVVATINPRYDDIKEKLIESNRKDLYNGDNNDRQNLEISIQDKIENNKMVDKQSNLLGRINKNEEIKENSDETIKKTFYEDSERSGKTPSRLNKELDNGSFSYGKNTQYLLTPMDQLDKNKEYYFRGQSSSNDKVAFNNTGFQGDSEGGVYFTTERKTADKYGNNIIAIEKTKDNVVTVDESNRLQEWASKIVNDDIKNGRESDYIIEQMALGRPRAFAEYTKKPFVETGDLFGEPNEAIYYEEVDNGTSTYGQFDDQYMISDNEDYSLYKPKNQFKAKLSDGLLENSGVNLPLAESVSLSTKKGSRLQLSLPGYQDQQVGTPTRHEIIQKNRELAKEKIGDITKIKDKKKGILYQMNTMKRNLRDIMTPEQAADMYDTYFKPITKHNSDIEKEITTYNERIQKYNLSNEESVYTQMVGELKYNPESDLRAETLDDYYKKHIDKIDKNKVNKAVEEFRNIYDELIVKVNNALTSNGYKPIEYRKGYFPHFIEEKATSPIGKLAEKLGWKIKKGTLPTDIAGITDQFKPGKAWTSFSQHRTGKATDYNALKGLDNYLRGAMDTIYHTEDIQKLRALENEIRYQYSDKGIKEKIDSIYADDDLDMNEKNEEIYNLTEGARNGLLGNFATELRNYTDNLANKKSFSDRSMEQALGRDTYSIMENINSRVSANMVGANISSALTNFIPITQAWSQVSTRNLMKGMYESIKSSIKDDGFANNSVYLTNRTKQADRLYKTGIEKINDKLSIPFEAIDNFTSNTIVRAKYYENLDKGMSEQEAISNADEFAKDVMAGRSKGDMPTIMNKKNPITKLFTAFQLEVNNQYGYMFKDIKADIGDEAKDKLAAAFVKMFFGAWLYNYFAEKITGRKSAFSPVDMVMDDIKTATNENLDLGDKLSSIVTDTAKELPFVGGLMGGGRLPIQGAIPYENPLSMVTETINDVSSLFDEEKKDTAIKNLTKEWSKPVYYIAMPFAGGQIKKTVEGLSMYDENLPIAGSYTNSGRLRFEADDSMLGKLQAAVFGQYASKNARDYFDNGYSPLTENQINATLNSNVNVDEYRNNKDEYDYAYKEPEKYAVIKQISDFNTYNNYKESIKNISDNYSERLKNANNKQKDIISKQKKNEIFNYINTLDLNKYQKTMLYKLAGGYSIKTYKNEMYDYIESLELSADEKKAIYEELFK